MLNLEGRIDQQNKLDFILFVFFFLCSTSSVFLKHYYADAAMLLCAMFPEYQSRAPGETGAKRRTFSAPMEITQSCRGAPLTSHCPRLKGPRKKMHTDVHKSDAGHVVMC